MAIYARVSTQEEQNPEVQIGVLQEFCKTLGWEIHKVYEDKASAADMRGRRAWQQFMSDAQRHKFDLLLVWKLDRAFRSVLHAVNTLELLRTYGVGFKSYQEAAIDTTTAYGEFMFHIMSAFAELERQTIRERVQAGVDHAKAFGTRTGRPFGRPRKEVGVTNLINAYRISHTIRGAARALDINPGLAYKRLKQAGVLD